MNAYEKVSAFLGHHGFPVGGIDINAVIDGLLYDMRKGLSEGTGEPCSMDGAQDMIPTWSLPPKETPKNTSVIVIDAGGTNFRSCLVTFDADGKPTISNMEKCAMPGIDRELSKKEFFDAIATNLEHLKNASTRIGFCFSYAMSITPDGDGEVIAFSKEIKASEVIGSRVGACLADALVEHGWNRPEKIVLLNDTTSALLAGATTATGGRSYSSYIGLILGTGLNSAYIESEKILKIANAAQDIPAQQIVVCESGKYDKLPRATFDVEFDRTTNTPNRYVMEKMCSGGYLGPVVLRAVKLAGRAGLFSKPVASAIELLTKAELKDIDQFLYTPYNTTTAYGSIMAKGTAEDYDTLYVLLDAFIDRSARLTAAIIAASVIKSGQGTRASQPVCILCEGTTFAKTHNLKQRLIGYLEDVLRRQRKLHFEIISMDNAITLGAAVAGLSR